MRTIPLPLALAIALVFLVLLVLAPSITPPGVTAFLPVALAPTSLLALRKRVLLVMLVGIQVLPTPLSVPLVAMVLSPVMVHHLVLNVLLVAIPLVAAILTAILVTTTNINLWLVKALV